ncbi:MAG: SpoVG family protein [Fibrobacteres bacterium]|nr:SpoVG family protein [Fibrobacterota bacterium]
MNTNIQVTDVKVFPLKNKDSKVKAMAHVILNNCFRITGLKVVEGINGLFIGWPAEKGKDGNYHEIFKPTNRTGVDLLQDVILREYDHAKSVAA